MITDRRKVTTKITLYGIFSFHFFTVGINSESFPGLYTPYKKHTKFSATSDAG